MYQLLMVDDEAFILNYLFELFQKNFEDRLSIDKVSTGEEAIELIEKKKYEIAILDVCIPKYSGFDLAKKMLENWSDCRIIFLSAMNNFDYVYSADKIPNATYFLKSESDNVIVDIMRKTIKTKDEEVNMYKDIQDINQNNAYLNHLIYQSILQSLFLGQSITLISKRIKEINIKLPLQLNKEVYIALVGATVDVYSRLMKNRQNDILTYYTILQDQFCDRFTFTIYVKDDYNMFILFQPNQEDDVDFIMVKNVFDKFIIIVEKILSQRLAVSIYRESFHFEELNKLYQNITDLHNKVPFSVRVEDFVKEEKKQIEEIKVMDFGKSIQNMERTLVLGDKEEYKKNFANIRESCIHIESMHNLMGIQSYLRISVILINFIRKYSMEKDIALECGTYGLYYLSDFKSWEEAFYYLEKVSNCIFHMLQKTNRNRNDVIISRIKGYIKNHIDTKLTLGEIGDYINYNESYVSRIFKQITGMGISDYINAARLEKGSELLVETDLSVQEISSRVGFDSPQYFSAVFKKNMGETPGTYRLKHNKHKTPK